MFEWIADPTIWLGLLTLVTLEIVLGIDNLIFIAILAEKLPPSQRDKARLIGLTLALVMRLGLLASISWIVSLTDPLFSVFGHGLSGRDLILLGGGLFLLYKSTTELHERLEGGSHHSSGPKVYAGFAAVIAQIIVLDLVFSLDSVITAVGMVNDLPVMMIAVIIAVATMMFASKPLTRFVNAHPTVVVLCLGFLLMIGFSLIAEGFGFHIPKGYLYAAIGFSVAIEAFNQLASSNRRRAIADNRPLRERTAEAVLRLLGAPTDSIAVSDEVAAIAAADGSPPVFEPSERGMIQRVLTLAEQPVETVMTPRAKIVWFDVNATTGQIRDATRRYPYNRFLVARDTLNKVVGVAETRELVAHLLGGNSLSLASMSLREPLTLRAGTSTLRALEALKRHPVPVAIVIDARGAVSGMVTASDLLAAIAGDIASVQNKAAMVPTT